MDRGVQGFDLWVRTCGFGDCDLYGVRDLGGEGRGEGELGGNGGLLFLKISNSHTPLLY